MSVFYCQLDYEHVAYPNPVNGRGTIANNGCSVTCLAMVATYLTGHEYLPDELARYFGGVGREQAAKYEGIVHIIEKRMKQMGGDYYQQFVEEVACPMCQGRRLSRMAHMF